VFNISYGGEEKYTSALGYWLFNKNFDVTVLGSTLAGISCTRLSGTTSKVVEKQLNTQKPQNTKTIHPPYLIYVLSRLFLVLLWVGKLIQIHRKHPITLIHAQDTGYGGLAAIIASRIMKIPVIISSHGIRHKTIAPSLQGRFNNLLLRLEYCLDLFTVKRANITVAVNPFIKEYYSQLTNKDIRFIPIPIEVEKFKFSRQNREQIRKELGISESLVTIGFVGRFTPEKNFMMLIDSFARISTELPSLRLIVIGTGPLEESARNLVVEKRVQDKVVFAGVRTDVERWLSAIDIFVLPSLTEGMSTSLLEAMSCERAVVCSDIPANRALLLNNKDALLINPLQPKDFENAIMRLSKDETLRSNLSLNAKKKAASYDEDSVFPLVENCYAELAS
jgi:glycosyltransferase involved in cell wall biosynthesis